MSMVLAGSIVLRLAALVAVLLLLRRVRDWLVAIFAILILLLTARALLAAPETGFSTVLLAQDPVEELMALGVSVMCLVATAALDRLHRERHAATQALRAGEERFDQLIDNLFDVVLVLSVRGTIRYVSTSVQRLLGYPPEELIDTDAFHLVHAEDSDRVVNFVTARLATPGFAPPIEIRVRDREGSWHIVELVANNRLYDLAVRGIVVTLRDVSERRHLQRQLLQAQKMESVGRLAGGIAHDFNNVLTAILGGVELVKQSAAAKTPIAEELDEITNAAQRAAKLTRQLLAFSRRQILEPQILSLNDLLHDVETIVRRLLGEDVRLETRLAPDLGAVRVDRSQLEQVVMNLAVNARDAMPDGGTLTVETANAELDEEFARQHVGVVPGPCVMLAVTDTGTGMTDEVKAHVFEPFFTTKPPDRGTGLGLATCYGIVKQSGGNIWIYSEPGEGTSVKIFLPRVEERPAPPLPVAVPENAPRGTETVLVVEDDASVREIVVRVLAAQGYTVLAAPDGPEALDLEGGHPGAIQLVVSDLMMPAMRGTELVERLRERRPDIKALVTSGYTDRAIFANASVTSGLPLLQKPFTVAELARRVREALDG